MNSSKGHYLDCLEIVERNARHSDYVKNQVNELHDFIEDRFEKETPKKVIKGDPPKPDICPNCKMPFHYIGMKQFHNYCMNCGQRLDFEDELQEEKTGQDLFELIEKKRGKEHGQR